MLDKFKEVEAKFSDIERKISDPEVISDQAVYQALLQEHAGLKEGVAAFRDYQKTLLEIEDMGTLLKDPEFVDVAKEELIVLEERKRHLYDTLQVFLMPKDPHDGRNSHIEIRSGTGGDEAALFSADLFRMYSRYAELNGWKTEILSQNITPIGGIKEIIFVLSGVGTYSHMKFEIGTHRVQRVPSTETSGRIHTSAATVAVLPEVDDIEIKIDTKDLRIDTFRASGAGGQHVNKTSSAIRITHLPTNVVVECQDERSQFQNKDKALRLLRTRLYERQEKEQHSKQANLRKDQVGSGDRSEKIRTYNFPQGRITDHRINLTVYTLDKVLNGELHEIIAALTQADRLKKIQG